MKSKPSCGMDRATVPKKYADGAGKEQIDHHPEHEQRNRAGDRDCSNVRTTR